MNRPYEIARLALVAATELDKASRGRPYDPESVSRLAHELDDPSLVECPSLTFDFKSLLESCGDGPFRVVDDLAVGLAKRVAALSATSPGDTERAKLFCLALHRTFSAREMEEWRSYGFAA